MRWLAWLWLVPAVGCTRHNPAADCPTGTCSDPSTFCDVDGTLAGEPGKCLSISCTPNQVHETCRGNELLTCNQAGNNFVVTSCPHGCLDSPVPHCAYLEPKYFGNLCDDIAIEDLIEYSSPTTISTAIGCGDRGGGGAPSTCYWRAKTIVITPNTTVRFQGGGTSSNGIALIADYELRIEGVLDASAIGPINGPGAWGASSTDFSVGGGGGGGQTQGGAGGTLTTTGGAGNGGLPQNHPAMQTVLYGGNAGGPQLVSIGERGGGGGGAVSLIACRGVVSISGTVVANGGGGLGGYDTYKNGFGGGGGGNIVIQALDVMVSGFVFSNGGGGGCRN